MDLGDGDRNNWNLNGSMRALTFSAIAVSCSSMQYGFGVDGLNGGDRRNVEKNCFFFFFFLFIEFNAE